MNANAINENNWILLIEIHKTDERIKQAEKQAEEDRLILEEIEDYDYVH
jgi:hypothetical protein